MNDIIDITPFLRQKRYEVISELGRATCMANSAREAGADFRSQYSVIECMVFLDGEVPESVTWAQLKEAARNGTVQP